MSRSKILEAMREAKAFGPDALLYISVEDEEGLLSDGLAGVMGPQIQGRFMTDGSRALPTLYGLPVCWGAPETKVRLVVDLDENGLRDMVRAQKNAIDILLRTQQRL